MSDRQLRLLALMATMMSVAMYVSYVDQIRLNLAGETGSIIQPLVATLNCTLWVGLGMSRRPRDWPVAIASAPGIVLGALAVLTAW